MRGRGRGKATGGGGIGKKIEEQGKKTSTGGLRKPWGDLVRRQRGGKKKLRGRERGSDTKT